MNALNIEKHYNLCLYSYHDDPARVSIYSCDSLKRTGLHYAALMGKPLLINTNYWSIIECRAGSYYTETVRAKE